jgi:hypothetical protein
VPRKSAFGRLLDHFHTHPQGRLHEILFWNGLGLVLGALALALFLFYDSPSAVPFSLLLGIVALCVFLWGYLPQKKAKPAPRPAGRLRAEKAAAARASKEEGRRARAAKRGDR